MPFKRIILLYCANTELLTTMTRNLQMYACDVTAVHDAKEAIALTKDKDHAFSCGVLVHTRRADPVGRLIHLLLENGTRMPLLHFNFSRATGRGRSHGVPHEGTL